MGVSIVKFKQASSNESQWGVLRDSNIFPVETEMMSHQQLMKCFFEHREDFNSAVSSDSITSSEVTFLSPISRDVQLFCQGLNYGSHREEGGLEEDAKGENLIFTKAPSSICGPNDDIIRPKDCQLLDYEIELALVLKHGVNEASQISEDQLPDLIGGLVLANDVSSRDHQFGATAMQWFKGKSFRTFCPMGPVLYLLEKEDFAQLYQLQLTLKVNGEVKQSATTEQLIHKPAATISEISNFADLNVGDCILTGTPGGVLLNINLKTALGIMLNLKKDAKRREKVTAAQLAQTKFLQPNDLLELEIKSIDGSICLGKQSNKITTI